MASFKYQLLFSAVLMHPRQRDKIQKSKINKNFSHPCATNVGNMTKEKGVKYTNETNSR